MHMPVGSRTMAYCACSCCTSLEVRRESNITRASISPTKRKLLWSLAPTKNTAGLEDEIWGEKGGREGRERGGGRRERREGGEEGEGGREGREERREEEGGEERREGEREEGGEERRERGGRRGEEGGKEGERKRKRRGGERGSSNIPQCILPMQRTFRERSGAIRSREAPTCTPSRKKRALPGLMEVEMVTASECVLLSASTLLGTRSTLVDKPSVDV